MHILTVLDHPNPASFTTAAARRFMAGAEAAGHTTELADLHAEGFDPRWTMADVLSNDGAAPAPDIKGEQARIERADAICLAFPLFWWGMPAMMKGWTDRVWAWGWAYNRLDDPDRSAQRNRSAVLLVCAGARSDEMEASGYTAALETVWTAGTFGYFGFAPRRLEILHGTTGSEARRTALLNRAYQTGQHLPPPDPART